MSSVRLNITLPEEVVKELNTIQNKSNFIAETLREKINELKMKKIDELLVIGYKETCKEDKEINEDWESVSLEDWK